MKKYSQLLALILCTLFIVIALLPQHAVSQTKFKKYSGNPVLTAGPAGSWDERVDAPAGCSVMYLNSKYHMWYKGYKGSVGSIGYAFSDDGITWTKYSGNPVLVPGAAGDFDASLEGCYVLFYSGKFHMWYDGYNAEIKTGYAYSDDGKQWTKHLTSIFEKGTAGNWDVTLGGVGAVIKEDTLLKMFYWGKTSTGSYMTCLATSPDSIHWTRYNSGNPVLAGGVTGAWDQYSQAPSAVLKNGGLYEMWYSNWTPSPYCIGYASSTNGGLNWTTNADNPILRGDAGSWDAYMTIWPMVVRRPDGHYLLYYTGANSAGKIQGIGLAIDTAITQLTGTLLTVPQQYSTIQSAIKASSNGDTVLVSEGTYYENINFLGKAITVASTYLTTGDTSHISRTIIDGSKPSNSDSASVVYFISGEDTNSVLCGFTITGGTGTLNIYGARIGGGVHCRSAGARLTKNIITQNRIVAIEARGGGLVAANINSPFPFMILEGNSFRNNFVQASAGHGYAGGVYLQGISARIDWNVFESDTVLGTEGAFGGGMCFYGPTETGPFPDAYIHGNIFRANIISGTNYGAWGGGINMTLTGNTTLSENVFEGNIATSSMSSAGAGGLLINDVKGLTRRMILRNRFVRNRANGVIAGGGAMRIYKTLATLDRNEFIDNSSDGSGGLGYGGGVSSFQSSFRMENNIFSMNYSQYGGGIYIEGPPVQGTEQLIINNTIFDNNATTGGGLQLSNGANAVILNNIFWGDIAASGKEISLSFSTGNINYCNIEGGWSGGIGNINADPQFVLPRIDSLQSSSPCIGAGRDTMTIGGMMFAAPIVDIHGHTRKHTSNSQPDIGVEDYQGTTGIAMGQEVFPITIALMQNYPNPFNPSTTIRYALPSSANVKLCVYDLLGREIATLVNEEQSAGWKEVEWNGSNVSSGMYFYKLEAGGFAEVKKLMLLK